MATTLPVQTRSTFPAARHPSVGYVLPFVVFVAFLVLQQAMPLPGTLDLVVRIVVLTAVLAVFSRHVISFRLAQPALTILTGVAVFVLWLAPDLLFPHYRESWLFQNSVLGTLGTTLHSSIAQNLRSDPLALALRCFRAVILVPIIEELFWRGWMMRWLINPHFEKVRLGAWTVSSFAITALLFASEHGPYWDVGLMAGVIYNVWMVRTKSLGDCILAHAITNACLSAYVIAGGQWQYWQ